MQQQILKQSKEWHTPLYTNFIDLEKVCQWEILYQYGIPEKLVKMLYKDFSLQVICGTEPIDAFQVNTCVKQRCSLSLFVFHLGMERIMKRIIVEGRRGIHWTLTTHLEDLDFADNVELLSH